MSGNTPMDGFLHAAKNIDCAHFSKKAIELAEKAEKGIYPCKLCESYREFCGAQCLPWYKYFQYKWQRIQKAAKIK